MTTKAAALSKRYTAALLEAIAREYLGIPTLDARGSDALDFHDLSVWQLRAALEAAYEAGLAVKREPRG